MVKKLPPTVQHNFRRIKVGKKSKTLADKVLNSTEFRIVGNSLSFNVKQSKFSGTFELSSKFDIPMPVRLSKATKNDNEDVGASKSDAVEASVGSAPVPEPKSSVDLKPPKVIDLVSPEKVTKKKSESKNEACRRKLSSESAKKPDHKKRGRKKAGAKQTKAGLPSMSDDRKEALLSEPESDIVIVFDAKTASEAEPLFRDGKRKASADSEVEQPPQKRRKLSGLDSRPRECLETPNKKCDSSSTPGPKPTSDTKVKKQRKALTAVDPNQKSILQYFFSSTSPVS